MLKTPTTKTLALLIATLTLTGTVACGADTSEGNAQTAQSLSESSATPPGPASDGREMGPGRGHRGPRGPMDPAQMFAQWDQDKDGKVLVSELPQRAQQRLSQADTNGDGALTLDELRAHHEARRAQMLKAADKDGDGKLSEEERRAMRPGPGGPGGRHGKQGRPGQGGPKDPTQLFSRFDQDGDGKVALSELPPRAQERIAGADTNQDGVLTLDEFKAHHEARRAQWKQAADTDGDGTVSEAELRAMRSKRHQERFAADDKNGDGFLTENEVFPFRWQHLVAADANQDGKLTQKEIQAAIENGKLSPPPHRGHRGQGPAGKGNGPRK